ncbi:FG-GAP repeat domain-containing protein [Streptomyces vilmorinianum]|uniref:FG-GAP repeat domain-containing protein n=1 Tax=Streptomyces vilmorinianum TaxID=3051092 RepID=UPI0010FAF949|nr:VCBS repeat-containing protein [Streptomyces vilmorinianum]
MGAVAGRSYIELSELFERRRLPRGTPILLDATMRPVEPLTSWFRAMGLAGYGPGGHRGQLVWMDWELSQDGWATVVLRHTRTGITTKHLLGSAEHPRTFSFAWDAHDVVTGYAPNGDYTWTITAESVDGVPLDFTASGSFKVVRKTAPHDFNDNGSLDVLQRDSEGVLWRVDTSSYDGSLSLASRRQIGRGWQIYDRIEATGNLGGTEVGDLLARDRSGVLWLYQGNGLSGFATRIKVGTGWQIYDKIEAGSDLTNDGRADVIATDKYGGLWLYPGTGNAAKPYSARKKIGMGWGIYNELTAVGNIAGGAAGDVVARDKYGLLWQYLGKGDGTFAPRTKIGGGWNTYTSLVGVGDVTKDVRPDLVGFAADSEYLYRATGDWRAPFARAQQAWLHYPATGTTTLPEGESTENGSALVQWPGGDGDHQRFRFG